MTDNHWPTWFAAAAQPDIDQAIAALYANLDKAVEDRSPRCDQSGRCCSFEAYGHRLYVTALETARFLRHAPPVPQSTEPTNSLPLLHQHQPGCRYQVDKLCTVHTIRPLGCRVYFCEPGTEAWQQDTYEHFMAQLRHLHEEHHIPYAYLEWRAALDQATQALSSSK
ncbi:YkgJ family cysteine cluster protein [Mucisphaera sp.]|uniref:YkgJ family cysteine cluster protein n=1 Tax=Mucisphaera sp. TaxID=2913024 RepID=UPI003D0AD25F